MILDDFRAYPIIRRRFMTYVRGVRDIPPGADREKLFWDYLRVRRRNAEKRVSMSEYMIFGFYALPLREQKRFLTDAEATRLMRLCNAESEPYLKNKVCFLRTFSRYAARDWLYLPESTEEAFRAFVSAHGTVALKPAASSWGIGFRKLSVEELAREEGLFERLAGEDYLAEEYLVADDSLARYHPDSLNTVRIITMRSDARFAVLGAGLRTGNNGLPVDNAHGGGIFCEIDPQTGVIQTDGLDEYGNHYTAHPMTGIAFRGEQIPRWSEMLDLCRSASMTLPFLHVVGWDVTILRDGRLELIEGNHNPGMNIVQAPAKRGIFDRFTAMMEDYYGISAEEAKSGPRKEERGK